MASPWFCDLSDATFVDRTGDDVANELTGPAGFQAAIRGTGNATALVAGDILYLYGTGDLSRLIEIGCDGTDVSGTGLDWAIGDAVRNLDGVTETWTGVIVEVGVGGSTDVLLVWLDAGLDIGDIIAADGIENTTQSESVDPVVNVITPGIEWDGNEGSRAAGQIKVISVTDENNPTTSHGEAILDGTDHAANKVALFGINFTAGKDFLYFEYLTIQNTNGDGWYQANAGQDYSVFWKCGANGNAGNGWNGAGSGFRYGVWIQCEASNNTGQGIRRVNNEARIIFCSIIDNASHGIETLGAGTVVCGCILHSNGGAGFSAYGLSALVMHCVCDENTTNGVDFTSTTVNGGVVIGSRLTNQAGAGDFGIDSATAENFVRENWNAFFGNDNDRNNVDTGPDSSSAGADDGYTNQAGNDFNVADGKTLDSSVVTVP